MVVLMMPYKELLHLKNLVETLISLWVTQNVHDISYACVCICIRTYTYNTYIYICMYTYMYAHLHVCAADGAVGPP